MRKLTLLTNGPGELWGWVRPLLRELGKRGISATIALLPCQFACGEEERIAEALGARRVLPPPSTLRDLGELIGEARNTDCIVQLGGDLLWGRIMARIGGVPLLCYAYGKKRGMSRCSGVYTAFPAMAEGIPGATAVGDLVADDLEIQGESPVVPTGGSGPLVAFFPGSRENIRILALPFFRRMKKTLEAEFPAMGSRILLSPFARTDEERLWKDAGFSPVRGGEEGAFSGVDFAVTQPGTNTLELLHRGIPFLTLVPFSALKTVPLTGLMGMAVSLPLVGASLRNRVLRAKGRKAGFLAWPNRLAGRELVDEMIGEFTPEEAASKAAGRLRDHSWLAGTKKTLTALSRFAPPGAARRLSDEIERMFAPR